jgi:hypothetical protein
MKKRVVTTINPTRLDAAGSAVASVTGVFDMLAGIPIEFWIVEKRLGEPCVKNRRNLSRSARRKQGERICRLHDVYLFLKMARLFFYNRINTWGYKRHLELHHSEITAYNPPRHPSNARIISLMMLSPWLVWRRVGAQGCY